MHLAYGFQQKSSVLIPVSLCLSRLVGLSSRNYRGILIFRLVSSDILKFIFINQTRNYYNPLLMQALLQSIIQSPELLKKGDTILLGQLQLPQRRAEVLQILGACRDRNYIVLLQNVYPLLWPTLSQEQQAFTRKALLKMFYETYKNAKDIESLAIFVSKIHDIEGYDAWADLYKELLKVTLTDQLVEFLLVIYRQSDDRIAILGPEVMQQLMIGIQAPDVTPTKVDKLVILLYYIIKSTANNEGTDDQLFQKTLGGSRATWLLVVYQKVLTSPEVRLHKSILQQLTVLFSDAPKYSFSTFSPIINLIWLYLTNLVPVYLKDNVVQLGTQKPDSLEDEYLVVARFEQTTISQGLVYQGLQLLQTIFVNKASKYLMKFALYPLIAMLSHLLLITKRDQKQWLEQQNKFIADTEDESMIGIRNRVISFLYILTQRFQQAAGIILLVVSSGLNDTWTKLKESLKQDIITKGVMSQLTAKATEKSEQLQQIFDSSFPEVQLGKEVVKEAATLMLLTFAAGELDTIDKNSLLSQLRFQVETSPYPLLKIQSLNAIVRCVQEIQVQHIPNFFEYALVTLDSPYPGLRVISVKAVGAFLRKLRLAGEEFRRVNIQEHHISKVVSLVQSFTADTLHVFLDTCIQLVKYNQESRRLVLGSLRQLIPLLLQTSLTDGMIASQLEQLFGEAQAPEIQEYLLNKIQQSVGIPSLRQITTLCCRILEKNLESQKFRFQNADRINQFITFTIKFPETQSLIRQLLRSCTIDNSTLDVAVANIRPSWFIPLHKRGLNIDATPLLLQAITNVILLTSTSEVQHELVLPFYLMWHDFNQTINKIKSFGMYDQFVTKWFRYQSAFQGDTLRKVSISLASKIQQTKYQTMLKQYISDHKSDLSKVKATLDVDWEDQQMEEGGGQAWYGEELVNRIVQRQLLTAITGLEGFDVLSLIQGL